MATIKEEIKIIYEDREMLILNKAAGWVVTNEGRDKNTETVEDWVEGYFPNKLARKGIVHRLDKGTSGILVVAKTTEALINLKSQFKQRKVQKRYLALTCGDLPAEGKINMPIDRSKYSFGKFKVDEEGKTAVTEFKLLKKMRIEGKIFSLVEINLKTGRTHQIRVHFNYLGWPLAGDKVYGGVEIVGLDRPFLHAFNLTIGQPKTGEELTFNADLPQELQKILERNEK
jgi:23S rRNA pseudouridine1911/1915/1917 synthase